VGCTRGEPSTLRIGSGTDSAHPVFRPRWLASRRPGSRRTRPPPRPVGTAGAEAAFSWGAPSAVVVAGVGRRADVLDVPGGRPGVAAPRQLVPARVAVDHVAVHLADDGDLLAG